MPLPSQTVRSNSRRTHMYRRNRTHPARRWIGPLVVGGVLAGAAWLFGPLLLERFDRGAGEGDGASGEVAATPGAATPATAGLRVPVDPAAAEPPPAAPATTPGPAGADARTGAGQEPLGTDTPSLMPEGTRPPADASRRGAADPRGTTQATAATGGSNRISFELAQQGLDLIAANEHVLARDKLTRVLERGGLSPGDEEAVRDALARVNERLVFGPEVVPGDPFTMEYTIRSGDVLSKLPREMGLLVPWRFIGTVNRIDDPARIRVGQRIKLVTGPFHALVHKSEHRMDVYLGDGAEQVFVRSFDVGLGENDGTPIGRWRIGTKVQNPDWRNPRTGEYFSSDDPENPIGEWWLALEPDEERLKDATSYGIHGTIDPDSIGDDRSMGCVRMRDADIAIVYELLRSGSSYVEIRP